MNQKDRTFKIKIEAEEINNKLEFKGQIEIHGLFSPAEILEHAREIAIKVIDALKHTAYQAQPIDLN